MTFLGCIVTFVFISSLLYKIILKTIWYVNMIHAFVLILKGMKTFP